MSRLIDENDIIKMLNTMDRYTSEELTLCDTDKTFPMNEVFIVDDVFEGLDELPSAQPEVLACGEGELIAQPEQRWIPCSKELPERNRVVLVTTKWDEVTEGVKLSGNAWFIGRGEENAFDSDIIAWMPKPEPHKEGGAV